MAEFYDLDSHYSQLKPSSFPNICYFNPANHIQKFAALDTDQLIPVLSYCTPKPPKKQLASEHTKDDSH